MSDPNDNLGVGGGLPPSSPLGGPSLEAEEKAMKSGKGRMLAVMILAVVAAVAGLVLYMASGGEEEAYGTFGRNVNGLRRDHFDTFWGCALRGANLDDVRTNEDLAAAINQRATNGKTVYARHLRDDCMPFLADLEPKLLTLIPPEDLADKLRELGAAVGALRSAVSAYVAYIEGLGDAPYDAEDASEHVTAVARGWYDYKRVHNEINRAVAEKLER
jgi:hypothetical protein